MEALGGLLILVVAACAFFAAPRAATPLRWTLGVALVVFVIGVYLLFWAPSDYLLRLPALATVLHPYLVAGYVAASLVLATGISLGLLARTIHTARQRRRTANDDDP